MNFMTCTIMNPCQKNMISHFSNGTIIYLSQCSTTKELGSKDCLAVPIPLYTISLNHHDLIL